MSTHPELPEDVVAAIDHGRKIEAIKLLRDHRNLDLKTAKETVEAYAAGRPGPPPQSVVSHDSGAGRLVLIAIGFVILYFVYRYLAGGG